MIFLEYLLIDLPSTPVRLLRARNFQITVFLSLTTLTNLNIPPLAQPLDSKINEGQQLLAFINIRYVYLAR